MKKIPPPCDCDRAEGDFAMDGHINENQVSLQGA